jgi:radical SAM protein with 4Fe4S-binding SPASM domain
MLSFFNGVKTLSQCISEIAKYFDISEDEICDIISNYIENKEKLYINYNDEDIIFPKNVLIEKGNYVRKEFYSLEQFIVNEDIDLTSTRLYKPIRAIFELTLNCYTDCIYCYADRKQQNKNNYLPLEKIISIIREAKSLGFTAIEVNGGEVLIHPRWKEIFKELSDNGYRPLISTKLPLDKEALEYLCEIGMTKLQISLDSLNSATLTKMLNVKAEYRDKILKTMQMLDNMKFDWQVNTVITKFNASLEEIKLLMTKLISYKNIKQIRVRPVEYSMYKPQGTFIDIKTNSQALSQIQEYIQLLSSENSNIKITIDEEEKFEYSLNDKKDLFPQRSLCTANQRAFIILSDGKVTICEELYWNPHFIIGDLTKQSIMEMWQSEKATKLFYLDNSMINEDSNCKKCNEFSQCRHKKGVCWKVVIIAYGKEKWDYPDPKCPYSPKITKIFQ